ncbi:hypothetical protein DV735_g2154, partial [Chaetothyriales sp. CBS 134920]
MSLTRVSSVDQFERARRGSQASTHRRMSFSPMTTRVPLKKDDDSRRQSIVDIVHGYDDNTTTKRVVQVITAIIYCLFAAGIVFGYAAIKPVLIDEGVFGQLCTPKEIEEGTSPCYQQEIRLNLMFTIAAVSTNVAALPIGTILDRYGPRVCGIIGSVLLFAGACLFSAGSQVAADLYTPGYLLLALGGPFVFISSFQLSNTFPQRSGLILALLTGAFDASSALFLVFRLLYQATEGRLTTQKIFLAYLAVPILILLAQILIMPKESYKSVGEVIAQAEAEIEENTPRRSTPPSGLLADDGEEGEDEAARQVNISEITALLDKAAATEKPELAARAQEVQSRSGVWGAMHGYSALEQIRSPWFVLITAFTVVQMTRINYFVATIRPQEQYLLGSEEKAKQINEFFDIALPLGGIISIPLVGTLLDNTSTAFALGFLVVTATAIGILGCLPYTWAAVANVCLFVVYRPFYYTTVSDYAAKVFGFVTFGKVYGLIICLAGLFNLLQSPLDAATHVIFGGNPIPVNVILLSAAVIVGTSLVAYTAMRARTLEREKLEDEAELAREQLMPNAESAAGARPNGTNYGT